jgi:HAE1 family hydrophobic/amphiphilic exporter-1
MLCSRFLKPQHEQRHGRVYNAIEWVFTTWLKVYDRTLTVALNFRFATLAISVALLAGTVYLFMVVPKGFLPSEDQGRFNVSTEAAQGISFDDMVRHQSEVAAIIAKDPNVAGYTSNIGQGPGGSGGAINTGRVGVDLKPRSDRAQSVDQVIASLRPKLAQVAGVRVFMVNQPPINLGGTQGARSLYQFTLQDTDTSELYEWAPKFETLMVSNTDVSSDLS